jgi:RNA polymerase sigma-70 factor (ECF subfamily)
VVDRSGVTPPGTDEKRGDDVLTEADREIVEAIRSGDTQAFEELYRTQFRRVFNFSIRKLGDPAEAEDVTQEVFAAVFTCIDRFEGKSDLVVWIYGITRNILNNRLRRRGAMRLIPLDDVPPEAAPVDLGPEPRAEARETLGRVQEAIEQLPRNQRRILELRHGRRLAIRRIAEIMNRSEDAIKSSLYRARRTLASSLPEHGLELWS